MLLICFEAGNKGLYRDMRKERQQQGVHTRIAQQQFRKVFLFQVLNALLIAGVLLLHGVITAYSALLGGILYLLPGYFFARKALAGRGKQTAGAVIRQIYASEIWKMTMSVVLFSATFILIQPLNPFSLFGTYIWLQLSAFVAQMQLNNRFLKL